MASLNRDSFEPLYHQLARILRDRIQAGAWEPGALLPSEPRLGQEYDVGTLTVRKAVGILRREGLVETEKGVGSRVRLPGRRAVISLREGDSVLYRPATDAECRERGLPEGVWVAAVTHADGTTELHPAADVEFVVPPLAAQEQQS